MDAKQSDTTTASANRNEQAGQQGAATRDTRTAERQQGQENRQESRQDNRQENRMARRGSYPFMSPFALLQRLFSDDMMGTFAEPGRLTKQQPRSGAVDDAVAWVPKVDVIQRGSELVVRADLPGVSPDDVSVEVTDDSIILSGQRMQERVEDDGGVYRLERTYGAFFREIPLPEGAMVDRAKASFRDGVLEIIVPAPPEQVSRGRRLEISK
jgi:HSP20 family protein